jgi:hypothetical protein
LLILTYAIRAGQQWNVEIAMVLETEAQNTVGRGAPIKYGTSFANQIYRLIRFPKIIPPSPTFRQLH